MDIPVVTGLPVIGGLIIANVFHPLQARVALKALTREDEAIRTAAGIRLSHSPLPENPLPPSLEPRAYPDRTFSPLLATLVGHDGNNSTESTSSFPVVPLLRGIPDRVELEEEKDTPPLPPRLSSSTVNTGSGLGSLPTGKDSAGDLISNSFGAGSLTAVDAVMGSLPMQEPPSLYEAPACNKTAPIEAPCLTLPKDI